MDWETERLSKRLTFSPERTEEIFVIHPFQDGNGRTSRLLTNLLLLQHGYNFTTLISHEKLIEARRADYYLALNKAQGT